MATPAPTRTAVLQLYRTMLKNSAKFQNYNFREHSRRRVKEEFRFNQKLSPELTGPAFARGLEQSEMIKRQTIIGQLYPAVPSVMETVTARRAN